MSKFVGKFRKDRNYNDDYNYDYKRHRNEHSEAKKQLQRVVDDLEDTEMELLYKNNTA